MCPDHTDTVNAMLADFQGELVSILGDGHPDVGLLDLLSWTWASDHFGRDVCTPADMGGTHFGADPPRLAFVQQVLYAAHLLARDKAGWQGHLLDRC